MCKTFCHFYCEKENGLSYNFLLIFFLSVRLFKEDMAGGGGTHAF